MKELTLDVDCLNIQWEVPRNIEYVFKPTIELKRLCTLTFSKNNEKIFEASCYGLSFKRTKKFLRFTLYDERNHETNKIKVITHERSD